MVNLSIERVTPEVAEAWLAKNTHNRNLNMERAQLFAGAMARGEWVLNGETIKFAGENGNEVMIDGQTRTQAVVIAGVPVEMAVVRGLPMIAQDTVDLGQPRRLAHSLQLRGEKNATQLAAVVSGYFRYRNGTFRRIGAASYPTPQQGIALLEAHPGLRDSTSFAKKLNERLKIIPVSGGLTHYEFSRLDWEDADAFFRKLMDGAGLEEGSAILALRHVLERFAMDRVKARGGLTNQVDYAAYLIKAWNLWREGAYVKKLIWYKGGSRQEPFPIAR